MLSTEGARGRRHGHAHLLGNLRRLLEADAAARHLPVLELPRDLRRVPHARRAAVVCAEARAQPGRRALLPAADVGGAGGPVEGALALAPAIAPLADELR